MNRRYDYHVGDELIYRINISARYTFLIHGVMDQLVKEGVMKGTKQCPQPKSDHETIAGAPERVSVPRFFVVRTGHTDGHQMFGLASRATGKVYGQTLTRAEALRYQAVSRG